MEVDFFGRIISSRFVPDDPKSPLPVRGRDLRQGSIKIDTLPSKEHLDLTKRIRFRIPIIRRYERISLIKYAYLMVFSLMGTGGYHFAENAALEPIREQIMNPDKSILKGTFVANGVVDGVSETKKNLIALYKVHPSCWMVPLWNNNIVILPCGGSEPIDTFNFPSESFSIPNEMFSFWVSCRFNSSAPMVGPVIGESGNGSYSLVGTIDLPPSSKTTGEEWHWMIVYHHNHRYVALPCRTDGVGQQSEFLLAIEMLNKDVVDGSGMDKSALSGINYEELANEIPIHVIGKEEPD